MKKKFISKSPLLMGSKRSIGNKMLFSNNNKKSKGSKNSTINLRIKPLVRKVKQKPAIRPKRLKSSLNTFKVKTKYKAPTKYKVAGLRKMNWPQLKQRLPGLRPNSDADFDGLINSRDCKPLDPSKDGLIGRALGVLTGGKVGQSKEEYTAEKVAKGIAKRSKAKEAAEKQAARMIKKGKVISEEKIKKLAKEKENLETLKQGVKAATFVESQIRRVVPRAKERKAIKARRKSGFVRAAVKALGADKASQAQQKVKKTAPGQKGIGAGRPAQSYKYKDPRTGQPIPAVTYWKIMKQLKSKAKSVETQAEVQQRFELAKRGLSPEEIAAQQTEINQKMARLRALKAIKRGEIPEGYGVTEEGEIVEIPIEEQQQQQDDQQVMYEEGVEIFQEPQQYEQPVEQQVDGEGKDLSTAQLEYERQLQLQQLMQQQGMQQQVQQPAQQYQQVQQQRQVRPAFNVPGAGQVPLGYKLKEDLMTGRKWLEQLPPQEAWTR